MKINIPAHIAVIPDGNRRWAKKRGLAAIIGHEKGIERFNETSEAAFHAGVQFFTIWAGSEDNLIKRSAQEVAHLVKHLRQEIERQLASGRLEKKEIRFRLIGRWHEILNDAGLKRAADELESRTRRCSKGHLTILFGYDGKQDMLLGIRDLVKDPPGEITSDAVAKRLSTAELPPVDLVIRTGGEPHWSAGFLMWHTTDSQMYFTDMLWPDFDTVALSRALEDYAGRGRRFGS
jgi:undecaprenyl diphosphate synthase